MPRERSSGCSEMNYLTMPRVGFYALVLFASISNVIGHEGHDHDHDHSSSVGSKGHDHGGNKNATTMAPPKSMASAYLYGTLSVLIVSLLSFAGVIVLPFIKQKTTYNSVMLVFMSLAVGTMTSDAVLHLIPETLGLHGHALEGDHGDGHEHSNGHEHKNDKPYLGKLVVLLATLYVLYLLEAMAHGVSGVLKRKRTAAVHDASATPKSTAPVKNASCSPDGACNPNATTVEMWSMNSNVSHGHSHGSSSMDDPVIPNNLIWGMKPVAFVVIVSDAMHNFTDGLAIGAAFAKSEAAGLAVSIAVVCHELPHEVGDFAILLNTGMSVKKALLLNFLSALTCFAGVYPGILAGQQESLRQWIFAIVAGGFLYVALVHMLREIKDFGPLPRYLSVALQNAGLLMGFVIVLMLAVYEDQIAV